MSKDKKEKPKNPLEALVPKVKAQATIMVKKPSEVLDKQKDK